MTQHHYHEEPSKDWQDVLANLLEHQAAAESEALDDLIPAVEARVRVAPGGAYFVHAWDVYDAVRRRLKSGDLFRVGKQTFEVLEYMEEEREYWVRPFETEVTDEALASLLGG